jgi:hypothetical protein
LRKLNIELNVPNLFLYGDSLWIRGTVKSKYEEKIGDQFYRAVDINVT